MKGNGQKLRIKDLPRTSRPREKMISQGKQNLSNAELLAILLGSGTTSQNAIALGESLLRHIPLDQFVKSDLEQLIHFPGIGKSKASRILAALELGERLFKPSPLQKTFIRSTEDVLTHIKIIAQKRQEYLLVFYLNARNELLQKEIVGQGSLNTLFITAKEIFAPAFMTPCATIVIAHNHPSNDPMPSDEDIIFTTKIQEAGELLDIPLVDHIIVCQSSYFSFRENKTVHNR